MVSGVLGSLYPQGRRCHRHPDLHPGGSPTGTPSGRCRVRHVESRVPSLETGRAPTVTLVNLRPLTGIRHRTLRRVSDLVFVGGTESKRRKGLSVTDIPILLVKPKVVYT